MNTLILLCSLLAVTAAGFLKKDNPHTPKHPHTPKAPNPPKAPKAPHDSGYDNYGYGDSGYGDSGYGDPHGHHGSGYGYGNSYGPGYGHSGGYGYGSHGSRRGSHGYGRGGFAGRGGHGNVGSTPHGEKPLDELDKLYGNVADMLAKVKALSEQVEAISAALSIQEKELNNLELIFVELKETDARHDSSINKLHKHLDNVFDDAKSLEEHLTGLKKLNFVNTGLTEKVENKWAELQKVNIRQDGNFQALFAIVKDLKPKLFQVKSNNFQIFSNDLERDTTKLSSVKTYETRRMCEVGRVTIRAGENRVDYQYQTWFDNVPQILYGMAGYNFNLDAKEDPQYYGYGYPPKEPEAIGAFVTAYSTKTGIVFTALDTGFGDTGLDSMDIAFQACTIGPGKDGIKH